MQWGVDAKTTVIPGYQITCCSLAGCFSRAVGFRTLVNLLDLLQLTLLVEVLIAVGRRADGDVHVALLQAGDRLLRKLLQRHPELGELLRGALFYGRQLS
jgi:hypothetical protein